MLPRGTGTMAENGTSGIYLILLLFELLPVVLKLRGNRRHPGID